MRLLTGAGLLDATVVKVDAANDLTLLKAGGRFAPLPIAASRTVATMGFPDTGLQGFAPKVLARSGGRGKTVALGGANRRPCAKFSLGWTNGAKGV